MPVNFRYATLRWIMNNCYVFQTSVGPIFIAKFPSHYQVVFKNKKIGSFDSASQAAEVLGDGHTLNLFDGAFRKSDIPELSIPSDLAEWECI